MIFFFHVVKLRVLMFANLHIDIIFCLYSYTYTYYTYTYWSVGSIAGAVIGSLIGLAVAVVVLIIICHNCNKRTTRGAIIAPQTQQQTTTTQVVCKFITGGDFK